MKVFCRAQYLTDAVGHMRSEDYNAIHMVKAVKGLPLNPNAYTNVLINGVWTSIREPNKDQAIIWFAEWAAAIVDSEAIQWAPTILVPIPSSAASIGTAPTFRTALIAAEIAKRAKTKVQVAPYLKWKKPRPKSTDSASRKPEILFPDLVLEQPLPRGRIVLVDDVYTSGGHVIAATWRIRKDQDRTVRAAICCGQTGHIQAPVPFKIDPFTLDVPELA